VKLPRTITHDVRLSGARGLLDEFLEQLSPLAARVECLLVQLPPSLELDARVARRFLGLLRERYEGGIALEPRHASWFTPAADALLEAHEVARVAADPPRAANGMEPGGWKGLAYFRLHGSPRVYYSSYDDPFIEGIARRLRALEGRRVPCWCIFDNTTLGAGTANALALMERLEAKGGARS